MTIRQIGRFGVTLRNFTVLEWDADHLPPPDEMQSIAESVWADLESDLLDKPAQCVFSIISLTDDDAGPSVFVTGSKDRDVFHCRYRAVTEWA